MDFVGWCYKNMEYRVTLQPEKEGSPMLHPSTPLGSGCITFSKNLRARGITSQLISLRSGGISLLNSSATASSKVRTHGVIQSPQPRLHPYALAWLHPYDIVWLHPHALATALFICHSMASSICHSMTLSICLSHDFIHMP